MYTLTEASALLASFDMVAGLPVAEVQARLLKGMRLGDTGKRLLAFYLADMDERCLYQASGHSSTRHYALQVLHLDRPRTSELLTVGRALLTLPAIDRAFCEGRLSWSKVLELARVVSPEHEAKWLDRALSLSYQALVLEVRLSKPGSAPRDPKDRKGLRKIRFPISARVDTLTFKKWDLAKQKASDARGTAVDDGALMGVCADLLLSMEPDGTVPGWNKVDSNVYRIVLRQEAADSGHLSVETDLGAVPIDASAVPADTPTVSVSEDDAPKDPASPTPSWLRALVVARDGGRCRCCGSRRGLMVHHIRHRADGGPTVAWNLILVCTLCRYRHNRHYADSRIMPRWRERPARMAASRVSYAA